MSYALNMFQQHLNATITIVTKIIHFWAYLSCLQLVNYANVAALWYIGKYAFLTILWYIWSVLTIYREALQFHEKIDKAQLCVGKV